MGLDVNAIRALFPALQQDQVYFDNAGGSQTLGSVIDSIDQYLRSSNVQLGATYEVGKESTARHGAAYEAGARYLNAHPDEIVYGASTTQLFRNLSYALRFKPGDEIVVSAVDHEANIAPWIDLADRQDLVIKWWKPRATDPRNPELLADDLAELLSPRTRLVTCTNASNILGTINDVKAISQRAHQVGALVCVDGVAYAPHRPLDMKDLGVDFYSFSWYKVYGPHVSVLYGSYGAQSQLRSLGHFFNPHASLADKLGLAAASYELVQAIPSVVEYLGNAESDMWKDILAQEEALQMALLDYLNTQPAVTIYGVADGDPRKRVPTVSFTVEGWNCQALVEAVEADTNIGFRWGSFYSNRLTREILGLGQDGVIRVSLVHYNTSKPAGSESSHIPANKPRQWTRWRASC